MARHYRVHTGENPYQCNNCDKLFTKSFGKSFENTYWWTTVSVTSEMSYSCLQLEKLFKKGSLLDICKHNWGKHINETNVTKAPINKIAFSANHIRAHTRTKPYTYNQCEKYFRGKIFISWHFRRHTGEKPYACNECGKYFREKIYMTCHFRIHPGEKPYQCNNCDKIFTKSFGKSFENTHWWKTESVTLEMSYSCLQLENLF